MRIAALLYHDVVRDGQLDASGFAGAGAAVYKMEESLFRRHLDALAALSSAPSRTIDLSGIANEGVRWSLTFDDGGASARRIGELLQERGWSGHFFITGNRIDTPGFVSATDIRALHAAGHAIGAHSWSHPPRISSLPATEIRQEWERTVHRLGDILGSAVNTASVPGGFHSRRVADAAVDAGIRVLYNSEPVLHTRTYRDCLIVGRMSIQGETPARTAAALAAGNLSARAPQWLGWNLRKALKIAAGPAYERSRELLLSKRESRTR